MALRSIPANQIVSVTPSVLSAGGSNLAFNCVFLSENERIPVGDVLPFSSASSVARYFGEKSEEYKASFIYFNGFEGSHIKPATVYFYKYNKEDVAAFLKGGTVSGMRLSTLKTISGDLSLIIDGSTASAASIDLSAATSFSDAASAIGTALSATVTFDTQLQSFVIKSPTTGKDSTIDYASGPVAEALNLTQAKGAVISLGSRADTPASLMNDVVRSTQNWVTFTYINEPSIDVKEELAEWVNATTDRFLFIAWDTDESAKIFGNTTCFGAICQNREFDGVAPLYGKLDKAAFIAGTASSIDWTQSEGRITFKFRRQPGIEADITDETIAENLTSNGYNYYGAWATANDRFLFLAEGAMPGQWDWLDTYVNQIRINSQLQLALMELLVNAKSIPYNADGIALQRAACDDPINEALNFGSIRPGVALSSQQRALVNAEAKTDAATQIEQTGYFLLIQQASAQVRAKRESMPMTLWYADGGSVHKINMGSIAVQ